MSHAASPRELTDHYQITSMILGEGSTSTVHKAIHPQSKVEVAAKLLSLRTDAEEYRTEVLALSRVNHPNIVSFRGHKRLVVNGSLSGVVYMDLLDTNGSQPTLASLLEKEIKFHERSALQILSSLVSALSHLHAEGIAHRDIKPENCSIHMAQLKPILFDLGYAYIHPRCEREGLILRENIGTPLYMSPEVLLSRGYDPFAVDVWGLGILLYGMIYGDVPNSDVESEEELQAVMSSSSGFPFPCCSAYMAKLLGGMLAFQPEKRWTLDMIRAFIDEYSSN